MASTSPQSSGRFEHLFHERFDSLLPTIQERWPDLAEHTLEATRGSVDELVRLIERNTGLTPQGVREQLEELLHGAGDRSRDWAESLDPLEEQLEQLLDELNSTLNPKQQRRFARQQGQEHCRASDGEEQATTDQSAFFPIHFLQGNPHVQIHH